MAIQTLWAKRQKIRNTGQALKNLAKCIVEKWSCRSMHEVIYMKAEFEPWWMFEEWEEKVVARKTFVSKIEARIYRDQIVEQLKGKYPQCEIREEAFAAFWRDGEIEYCESCDDDMQMYHGILWLENGGPIKSF